MQKYVINGKVHNIIKRLYSTAKYSVKLSSGFTKSFSSNVGLKQGYILNPLLFNLFINDFPESFDQAKINCPP